VKTNLTKSKKQESPWSFRPDEDVKKLLLEAEEATGMDKTALINRALRTCGEKAIREIFAERREREQNWIQARAEEARPASFGLDDAISAAASAGCAASVKVSKLTATAAPIAPELRPSSIGQKRKGGRQ